MPASLEIARARRRLQAFCSRQPQGGAGGWTVTQSGEVFELSVQRDAVLRLHYSDGLWHLRVPCADGGWMAYPPCPHTDSFERVMDELQQAPLHVHW